jgi:hypothetical protein
VLPRKVGTAHDGAFTAQGIFGQFVYVNPREQVVAVVWSAWRQAWQTDSEFETYALLAAAVQAGLLYERWAEARRAEINLTLARQTAEWIEARDAARQAFGRADALRRLSDRG